MANDLSAARDDAKRQARQNAALAQRNAELARVSQIIADDATAAKNEEKRLRTRAEMREQAVEGTLYAAEMILAGQAAMEPSGVRRMLEIISRWNDAERERDLRGWEWYYLNSLCHRDRLTLAHPQASCVDWSPDNLQFASGGKDGKVRLYDAADAALLRTWHAHDSHVNSIAFSPDGRRLATASRDKTIRVWQVTTGELLATLRGHDVFVCSVSWSPDGTQLASSASDLSGEFIVWDVQEMELRHKVSVQVGESTIDWSPDGTHLTVSGSIYPVADLENPRHLRSGTAWHAAFSPDGKWIAAADGETVSIFSVETGELRSVLAGHGDKIKAVDWSPQGHLLASASDDDNIKIWEFESQREVTTLRGHTSWALHVKWSPDGKQLASVGNSTVKVWDVEAWKPNLTPQKDLDSLASLAWCADGLTLAVAGATGLQVRDAKSGRVLADAGADRAPGWTEFSPTMSWHPESHTIAVAHNGITLLDDQSLGVRESSQFLKGRAGHWR